MRAVLASWGRRFIGLCLILSSFLGASVAHAKQFLWEVSGSDAPMYLLGSVHAGKSGFYPLAKPIEDAYRRAQVLVVEADATDQRAVQAALATARYAGSDNLEQNIQAETRTLLIKQLVQSGQSLEAVRSYRPWMVGMLLMVQEFSKLGYSPEYGIDLHFLRRAKDEGKVVVELESIAQQFALLNDLSADESDAFLRQTLLSIQRAEIQPMLKQLIAAWRAGDPDKLHAVMEKSFSADKVGKSIERKLLDLRNDDMTRRIDDLLKTGKKTHLVVVGAAHLTGPAGIINQLRSKGYRVRQL